MSTLELARKYGVSIFKLHNIILELRSKGIEFHRQGRRYDFNPQDLAIIEEELRRRGYTPRKED